jgi:hypothetical protein
MKKLIFVFVISFLTISFGNLTAQDSSLRGDDPGLLQTTLQPVKNSSEETIATQCIR